MESQNRDMFCFNFFHMHFREFLKEKDVEALDDIIEEFRLMICEDAEMPEVWNRCLPDLIQLFPRYSSIYGKRKRMPRK